MVYNQCANKVLQYAIKSQEKHDIEVPLSLRDETPLPKPPRPKDVDCIIAGFPWYVTTDHSSTAAARLIRTII